MTGPPPRISLIVPSYDSHKTLRRFLTGLRSQSFQEFETIIVDSSPNEESARIIREFPEVRLIRHASRLLPHEARTEGLVHSQGRWIIFTDPDVYPRPDWIASLMNAHDETGGVIIGLVLCEGSRWFDSGVHLCKYGIFMGSRRRELTSGHTTSLLLPKDLFRAVGGFTFSDWAGDTALTWDLREHGAALLLEPRAVVTHHHLTDWRGFLVERYRRGQSFARLRAARGGWGAARKILMAVASLLPLRLGKILATSFGISMRGGWTWTWISTLPILWLGHMSWLVGEANHYLTGLVPRPRTRLSSR
jgi:GT2 family glycosyltransferase